MSKSTSSSNTPSDETHVQLNDQMIGNVFDGKYKILAFIDKGGMGTIYRARQISLDREVAIKLMRVPDDPNAEKRFFLEASMCARLQHPNTIRIFEFGKSDDGHVYIVMELLEGQALSSKIYEQGALETREALNVCAQICGALAEAHETGIVHRDIKPSNIFLHQPKDEIYPKLIDFGLVKQVDKSSQLSQTGLIMGSPMYMSPEQIDAQEINHTTDIYSLGMTLYTMLCGKSPFKKDTISQLLIAQIRNIPKPLSEVQPEMNFPSPVEWTVLTAIEKSPMLRFASMKDFQTAIRYCQEAVATGKDIYLSLENGTPKPITDSNNHTQTLGAPSLAEFNRILKTNERPTEFSDFQQTAELGNNDPKAEKQALNFNTDGHETTPLTRSVDPQLARSYPTGTLMGIQQNQEKPKTGGVKKIAIFGGIFVFVCIAAATSGFYFLSAETQEEIAATTEVESEISPVEPQTESEKKEASPIEINLQSEPNHAEVYHNDELLGNTPFPILLQTDEELTVELRLNGYESKSIKLNPRALRPTIHLTAIPETPVRRRTQPNRPSETTAPADNAADQTTNDDIQTRDPWAD